MKKSILILLIFSFSIVVSHSQSVKWPNLNKKEDLKALAKGKIICTDHSILKNIELFEVKDYWIIYIKNESLHDLAKEKIDRIEFPDSFWGPLKIEFINGKPKITTLTI